MFLPKLVSRERALKTPQQGSAKNTGMPQDGCLGRGLSTALRLVRTLLQEFWGQRAGPQEVAEEKQP